MPQRPRASLRLGPSTCVFLTPVASQLSGVPHGLLQGRLLQVLLVHARIPGWGDSGGQWPCLPGAILTESFYKAASSSQTATLPRPRATPRPWAWPGQTASHRPLSPRHSSASHWCLSPPACCQETPRVVTPAPNTTILPSESWSKGPLRS